ncbi:uncharacterized protein AMSG_04010 [Thecamonas trahens ATCC 50062]|uniref:Mediator of RNA polymerase II transcription subunit 27 n=1 Tax=Thecamonas trahens ATCC 50062 TaxID=461836 RepID=A0A0L0D912_THETB|nr:hypothetical protein AMSG_04010 [Thecamonas trahens ATCC 50062]KNC47783.1 hypothetical protein AMSG_04010 [Thecamonas trahens ATCC 50062]|eukprot:XP_013759261.1 hypothetical protein AMSG_04010 [Thecamonas trahens ATCC 50062]
MAMASRSMELELAPLVAPRGPSTVPSAGGSAALSPLGGNLPMSATALPPAQPALAAESTETLLAARADLADLAASATAIRSAASTVVELLAMPTQDTGQASVATKAGEDGEDGAAVGGSGRLQSGQIAARRPAALRKAHDALVDALGRLRSLRNAVAALPLALTPAAAASALDAAPPALDALLADMVTAASAASRARSRAAAVGYTDAARKLFPGLLEPKTSRKRPRVYAITPASHPSKRRKPLGSGSPSRSGLPAKLVGVMASAAPSFRIVSWKYHPLELSSRLARLTLELPHVFQVCITFSGAVGLAESDTLIPALISLSRPRHAPPLAPGACDPVLDAIEVHVRAAHLYFVSAYPAAPLPPLLVWLHSYARLYSTPCTVCGALVRIARGDAGGPMPPVFRPFRVDRARQGRLLAPRLLTVATTGSPIDPRLALAEGAYHNECFTRETLIRQQEQQPSTLATTSASPPPTPQ